MQKNLIDKKIDADIKPIKKPIQTPTTFNSVYKAKYTITGNPIIMQLKKHINEGMVKAC